VLAGEHLSGPAHTRLDFVGHEQNSVAVAQRPQVCQVAGRRHHVATLSLNRLDEDGRDIVGIEVAGEQILFDHADASAIACRLVAAELTTVAVGVRHVVHVGQQRTKPRMLSRLAGRERHCSGGPPVKCAAERDDGGPAGSVAGELDRCLGCFGSRVDHSYFFYTWYNRTNQFGHRYFAGSGRTK